MAGINLKTVLNKGLAFLNMGSAFKWFALGKKRRDKPFFYFEGKAYTYGKTYEEALRYAKFFSYYKNKGVKEGIIKPEEPLSVGCYLDNCPEFAFAFFGAAMSGATIIGANTGFRGETLANLINTAEAALLITSPDKIEEVERVISDIKVVGKDDIYLVGGNEGSGYKNIEDGLSRPEIEAGGQLPKKIDNFSPLIVIYTSGTTGAPKGVPCSHFKLLGAGAVTWNRTKLTKEDKGYICMPMFHSNAWFIGILPLMLAGGSFVLKPKFSASAFENDILEHGVTYMNYVGQPVHYILAALEKKYGSEEAVEAALAKNPKNKFRIAHGNGAPPVDRKKLIRYLGMEHVYELYGSTEAPITTVLMPGDPIESLGKLDSKKVVIINEKDQVCPPVKIDDKGKILNYEEAVGEIAKITEQNNIIFDGYFKNSEATSKKFRDGFYRSGDLGYVREIKGKRYLYFVGRTDDWIRKDGENFSAESVMQFILDVPEVALAAAYGAPCEVSDEKVMVALQLKKGETFKPKEIFDLFMNAQQEGGMDPKWMPDYIRIVDELVMTHQTQKILIRPLKRQHFNLEKFPDMKIYFRQRGDETYKELTQEAFSDLKKSFDETGRVDLLYAGLD